MNFCNHFVRAFSQHDLTYAERNIHLFADGSTYIVYGTYTTRHATNGELVHRNDVVNENNIYCT